MTAKAPGAGLRAGLAVAFAAPAISTVVACSAGVVVAGGLLNVCEPILATKVLHGSGSDYALLVTFYGVGMVAASALVARRGNMPAESADPPLPRAVTLLTLGLAGSAIAAASRRRAIAFAGDRLRATRCCSSARRS